MRWHVICDTRDMFESKVGETSYNDHPSSENVSDFIEAMRSCGYDASFFGGVSELVKSIHDRMAFEDAAFVNFSDGLDATYARVQVPVLCEILDVPYSGADVFASALMNNKHCSCAIIREAGMPAPVGIRATKNARPSITQLERILPVFIKPNTEGSSVGITPASLQSSASAALVQIEEMLGEYNEIVVERYIEGRDVTVFVFGNGDETMCLEPIELLSDSPFLDIGVKSSRGLERKLLRDTARNDTVLLVKQHAMAAYHALNGQDMARMDYRLDAKGEPYFIEANSCPRFSRTSEIGFLASQEEVTFEDYVSRFISIVERRLAKSSKLP